MIGCHPRPKSAAVGWLASDAIPIFAPPHPRGFFFTDY